MGSFSFFLFFNLLIFWLKILDGDRNEKYLARDKALSRIVYISMCQVINKVFQNIFSFFHKIFRIFIETMLEEVQGMEYLYWQDDATTKQNLDNTFLLHMMSSTKVPTPIAI